jgi:subtilisin family serine protease
MIPQVFQTAGLPAYHDRLLIMKMRPTVVPAATFAAVTGGPGALMSVGLSALATLERGGLIRRITPLFRQATDKKRRIPLRGAMAMLTESVTNALKEDPQAAVSLVELEHESDVPPLHAALANDPAVEFVSRVPVRYLVATGRAGRTATPSAPTIAATPPAVSTMWNLRKIQWSEARAAGGFKEATEIVVAVLDTGIDVKHPDLQGRVKQYVHSYPESPTPSGEDDIIGHGTHVSGTIGAIINNDLGINGICEAQLRVWKIFGDNAVYSASMNQFVYYVDPFMYQRALADCVDAGVDVVNLSIGGPGKPDHQEQQLFDLLLARGTTVVAAMGNDRMSGSPISYPAAISGVIAVGASNLDDTIANFSNRGDHVVLCAPGKAIWSTLPTYSGQFGFEAATGSDGRPIEGKALRRETDYDAWDGTSMACPHVAASTALLLARRGKIGPSDVRERLMKAADKLPGMSGREVDADYGAGRLNLLRLLS